MNATYDSIEARLRPLVKGECSFDAGTRDHYSTATGWYRIQPIGVVFPKNTLDVQNTVRFCYENEIPVIARGAGTGLAGQAIGMGIVIDLARYMDRILEVKSDRAAVEPGVVLSALNRHLRPLNTFFPIDPVSGNLCTLGGMIATNASGSHGVKYGSMKDHVESLTVVLSNGDVAVLGASYIKPDIGPYSFFQDAVSRLKDLLLPAADSIMRRWPRVKKNSSGYDLFDAVSTGGLDLRKLIIGSEGTLAVVTGATLKLAPIPKARIAALAYFADYASTVELTLRALETGPSAIELMDRTYFSIGKGSSPEANELILPEAASMLYIEYEGDSRDRLMEAMTRLKALATARGIKTFRVLETEAEQMRFHTLRETVSRQMNLDTSFGKSSFIEDAAVPLANLPAYIEGLSGILRHYGIAFSTYGHAGTGNIHCATFLDLKNPDHYRTVDLIASEVNDLAISLGGTLSGEHGDGFVRTPFLERLYGPEVYGLFRDVKNIFDPKRILNPGKIIGPQNTTILHDINFS